MSNESGSDFSLIHIYKFYSIKKIFVLSLTFTLEFSDLKYVNTFNTVS